MCKITFPILCAAIFAVISTAFQFLIWNVLFFETVNDEAFAGLWRPMNDAIAQYGMPFANFVFGLSFYFAYKLFSPAIATWCNKKFLKGVKFGLVIWLFFGLTSSLLWFSVANINETLMFADMLCCLLTLTIGGGVVSALVDKCCGKSCKNKDLQY